MIHADLDKILPEDDALEKISSIIEEVEQKQELFIITKSGRPAAAIINIDYLEELTGNPVPQKSESQEAVEIKPTPEKIEAPEAKAEPVTELTEEEPLLEEEMPPIPESSHGIKPTVDLRLSEDQEAPEGPTGPAIPTPTRLENTEPQPITPTSPTSAPVFPQPILTTPTTPAASSVTPPIMPTTPPPTAATTPPMSPTQPTPTVNQPYDNLPPEDPNSGSPMG